MTELTTGEMIDQLQYGQYAAGRYMDIQLYVKLNERGAFIYCNNDGSDERTQEIVRLIDGIRKVTWSIYEIHN